MGADFVQEAYNEIDEQEKAKILADEKVKNLIAGKSGRFGSKTYGSVTIKFRTAITKKLRNRIKAAKFTENTDKDLYELLAIVCAEAPWNNPNTWAVYDENAPEDGIGAMEIFIDIMGEIGCALDDLKKFRRE